MDPFFMINRRRFLQNTGLGIVGLGMPGVAGLAAGVVLANPLGALAATPPGFDQWRGRFWSSDGEDRSRFRNLFNLGREYRIEAARERAREMAAFAVIILTSAWPVVYMIVTVVKLLSKGRPLN